LLEALVEERLRSHPDADAEADPHATEPYRATPPAWATRYQVIRPHRRGGLGEVFVAHDEELHRVVSLKRLQDEHADHPDSRARFLMEGEVTGQLEHPGVVPVYGLGTYPGGRPYYAMRFIHGETLLEAIQRFHAAEWPGRDAGERSLALRDLLARFLTVCNAVAYAHSRGVVHRDLKPANVMLGPFGETLVVDWGLAKVLGAAEDVPGEASSEWIRPTSGGSTTPTQLGHAVGTRAYMAREQAAAGTTWWTPEQTSTGSGPSCSRC
jgi:serine/threonine protein kinase